MKRRTKRVLTATLTTAVVVSAIALNPFLAVRRYALACASLSHTLRLALITDLHSCRYGKGQATLLAALEREQPDLVLLGGDIVDDVMPPEPALELLQALAQQYTCIYVTGNHEFWTDRGGEIKDYIASLGITVLSGERITLELADQYVDILGLDDPDVGNTRYKEELNALAALPYTGHTSILLAHRPERYDDYLPLGCDLILNGHAHGGQWRVPLLLNGVWAPHQGLFPTYAGGLYHRRGGAVQVVSRGLARESTAIPRVFNRPELVVVELKPET